MGRPWTKWILTACVLHAMVDSAAGSPPVPQNLDSSPAQTKDSGILPSAAPLDGTGNSVTPSAPEDTGGSTLPEVKPLTGNDLVNAPLSGSIPAAGLDIAVSLRDLLAKRAERLFDRKNEREDTIAFYRERGFSPLWFEGSELAPRTNAAITFLRGVHAEGLDPADYPIPDFRPGEAGRLAEAEVKLTHSILDYARHAQAGRVHFSRISADVFYRQDVPAAADILAKLAATDNVQELLESFAPPHPEYRALKAKLAEIQSRKPGAGRRIGAGPVLRSDGTAMEDDRVPVLRERLGLPKKLSNRYDDELVRAVADFQKEEGLPATGHLTKATLEALNAPKPDRAANIIIANMERWRWAPRDLGRTHSILNIPDFTMKVVSDEKVVWQTKVVVGKPATPTPILSDTMKYITVNPTWNVPPSIVKNEYLPALERNPSALSRMGIQIAQNPDGSIRMYQPPGERNALGQLRFNFPNQFLVYQHDTPDKRLFNQERRAFSHGCMRVQNPERYAEIVLSITGSRPAYSAEGLRKLFGTRERQINLAKSLPVHITYQTAFVSDAGRLIFREDLYGHDARFLSLMKGEERRVADVAGRPRRVTSASTPKPPKPSQRQPHYSERMLFEQWVR